MGAITKEYHTVNAPPSTGASLIHRGQHPFGFTVDDLPNIRDGTFAKNDDLARHAEHI